MIDKLKKLKCGYSCINCIFLTKEMKDKFKLEHTISIVYIDKDKKRIAVKEIMPNEKDNN